MLMTAAMHMHINSAHAPSSTSPPPWFPVPAAGHHILFDVAASAPSPPATVQPPREHHHPRHAHAAPGARRVAKRRPRPSRRLPTTYISADPASFRRMVHQVTGADGQPLPPPSAEVLYRPPAPARAGATGPGALMLPTLDTSAFLLGTAGGPSRTDAPCDGSAALVAAAPALEMEAGDGVGGAYNNSSGSSCGGFPTLHSWDALF